jgi:uncharacterized protein (DUF2147 family)
MKKLALVATLLLAATSAHAGNSISFEVNGQKIRIEAPRNCQALSCLQISGISGSDFGSKSKRFDDSNYDDDNNVTANSDQPAGKKQSAPAAQAAAPVTQAPAQVAPPPAPVVAPVTAPVVTRAAPASTPEAPAVVASNSPAPAARNDVDPAPAAAPTTPVGIWSTEGNKGRVRVEPCGDNLCGYAVNSGEKILINMKPSDSKWTGRIHDPDSGRNYDSTITMKGPNALRVQGCAFGGMFCGGQTWSRVS